MPTPPGAQGGAERFFRRRRAGSRPGHVKSDPIYGMHRDLCRLVVALPEREEPLAGTGPEPLVGTGPSGSGCGAVCTGWRSALRGRCRCRAKLPNEKPPNYLTAHTGVDRARGSMV